VPGPIEKEEYPLKQLITIIALLFMASLAPHQSAVARDPHCDAIGDYLDTVDTLLAEEVHALVTEPGWAQDAYDATSSLNDGADFEDLSAGEIEPLIELLAIPGDVLISIEPEDIPEDATSFHESSTGFWITLIKWLEANVAGDSTEVTAALASMEQFANDNADAQAAIAEDCAGLLDSRMENVEKLGFLFDLLGPGKGDPEALANTSVEDFEGIGVYFLVAPQGWALASATPVRTPATAKVDATPETTPGT
jgi:hypothetical protein